MDLPREMGGSDTAYSPTDLVGVILAGCVMITMDFMARRKGINIAGSRVEVSKEMKDKPKRMVGSISLEFFMPSGIEHAQRAALESAVGACPVHNSLSPEIEYKIKFNYA